MTFGGALRMSIFGESHGKMIGVVVDGCPPGLTLRLEDVQRELDRRRPGQSKIVTQRKEPDRAVIASGVLDGTTTGAPIVMYVENEDTDPSKYLEFRRKPRPGHADYTGSVKFSGMNDIRGGGMFSGRLTAALVMAGCVARALLDREGVRVAAHTVAIGHVALERALSLDEVLRGVETNHVRCAVPDEAELMEREITDARSEGDSVGGVVEFIADGLLVGIGDPFFDSVESEVAHLCFSIPAVKGLEFGAGFRLTSMRGSQANDPYVVEDGRVRTRGNNHGGVLGGLTTGMPVRFRVAFKPTSSIPIEQDTVDLVTLQPAKLKVAGRHDPCIVPRAVPVVEACGAFVLADLVMRERGRGAVGK